MDGTEILAEKILQAHRICVFSGAGISCPSGIPDFRSADGLYSEKSVGGFTPEEIISHGFFDAHPESFYRFYKSKMLYPEAKPNAAHLFFASLETLDKEISVVTQNIDGLHQLAGSRTVFELHGSVYRNKCTRCGRSYPLDYIVKADGAPHCETDGAIIKPDVVLYGEQLDDATVEGALAVISSAELMIVAGTSLTVYPAASFVGYFRGNTLALINKSHTSYDVHADIVINDDIAGVAERLNSIIWQK